MSVFDKFYSVKNGSITLSLLQFTDQRKIQQGTKFSTTSSLAVVFIRLAITLLFLIKEEINFIFRALPPINATNTQYKFRLLTIMI
jgi:hypothetical protein